MSKLKREEKGVYSFLRNEEKVFVTRCYRQVINKNRDNVKSVSIGWSFDGGFSTYDTLRDLKESYKLK